MQDDNGPNTRQEMRDSPDRLVQELNNVQTAILRAFVEIAVRTEIGLRALDRAEERVDLLGQRVRHLESGEGRPQDESRQIELLVM
jgi:hypothetical protein